jgi:hypothetical protein
VLFRGGAEADIRRDLDAGRLCVSAASAYQKMVDWRRRSQMS